MKVFIADDSQDIRKRLVEIVDDVPDMEVVGQAQDTPEAIHQIKKLKPDVAILDIRMPGLSGVMVLDAVKKAQPGIKVIMLTNYPEPQYKEKCLKMGADHFLDKANDFHLIPELLAKMESARIN